ncbi:MAG: hypothetical protein CMC78_02285 [Flavobacteriaceae bacterium]|nr:hypothetical protein [Flavobacteriaceae bacterium]
MLARERYNQLVTDRRQFLDKAVDCSRLTLPYLIQDDTSSRPTHETLNIPWQSVGSKCVVGLAAKLMLAILPPQGSFFKFQVREDKLGEELPPEARSELDLSLSKMERMVMDYIAASNDRVVIHQALKHLIVGGNALLFMGKDGIKNYPLNRYVVNRDGNGNVLEIVTKELISRDVLGFEIPKPDTNTGIDETKGSHTDDVEVYTCVKLENGRWVWYQEVLDKIIPGSRSTAPKNASPWLVLTFNSVDGEQYGRGRVEEFLGDLKSLEGLSQALVEGAAAASKVIFLVSPSSTTKPATIAKAGNGAIVQGRAEDVQVVQVGKTADFSTAAQMAQTIERRLLEAFLVMNVRNAERVTAEEVRLTQLELEQQLGGIFSLLTVSFLIPYLDRTLLVLQRSNELPKLPKDVVRPAIVAGVNALGRGQDREALTMFVQTIAQTLGPESLMKFINPLEAIKRLAAAQGIDVLNLVKTEQQLADMKEEQMQNQQNQTLLEQAGQFANSKLADSQNMQGMQPPQEQPE